MKNFFRAFLHAKTPWLFNGIQAFRNRRYFRREFAGFQSAVRFELYPNGDGILVKTGPFQGLRYVDEIVWGSITPKWLGSYEAELHPIVREIIARAYPTIIDVGCAEGYYAVGLAVALPKSQVIAFDTDFLSRRQVVRLAGLNQVSDRVEIRTKCHFESIDSLSRGKTLIICDIEGFEVALLDPWKAGALFKNDILVEVHEMPEAPGEVENILVSRFADSHRVERIVAVDREGWIDLHASQLPDAIPRPLLRRATDEHRSAGRVWLWMRSYSSI